MSWLFALIKAQHDGANQRASYLANPSSVGCREVVSSGFLNKLSAHDTYSRASAEEVKRVWEGFRSSANLSLCQYCYNISCFCFYWDIWNTTRPPAKKQAVRKLEQESQRHQISLEHTERTNLVVTTSVNMDADDSVEHGGSFSILKVSKATLVVRSFWYCVF